MYKSVANYFLDVMRRIRDEEEGLALTEYLILLGLLTAAVVTAVILFGGNLGDQWEIWANWIETLPEPDPIS